MTERILKYLYDNISDETIYSIIINQIPKLKIDVALLIENSDI